MGAEGTDYAHEVNVARNDVGAVLQEGEPDYGTLLCLVYIGACIEQLNATLKSVGDDIQVGLA